MPRRFLLPTRCLRVRPHFSGTWKNFKNGVNFFRDFFISDVLFMLFEAQITIQILIFGLNCSEMPKNCHNRPKSPFLKFRPGICFSALESANQCKIDRPLRSSGQYGPIMGQNKILGKNDFYGVLGGFDKAPTGALICQCGRLATFSITVRCSRLHIPHYHLVHIAAFGIL